MNFLNKLAPFYFLSIVSNRKQDSILQTLGMLCVYIFLGVGLLNAQPTPEQIKSGGFKWGESKRESETEASNAAKADLIQRIVQTVINEDVSGFSQEITQDKAKLETYVRSRSKVASRMQLRGLNVMQLGMEGNLYKALAYISNEDYAASLKAIANEVIAEYQTGEQIEATRGLANAIPVYYRAYLKTYLSPDLILYESPNGSVQKNFQSWLYDTKLVPFLRDVKVTAVNPTNRDVDVINEFTSVTFEFKYRGEVCQNLKSWLSTEKADKKQVINGRAKFEFPFPQLRSQPPDHTKINYDLGFRLAFSEGASSELKEIEELSRNSKNISIDPIEVTVDYREVIEFNLSVKKLRSSDFEFEIITKNFSIENSPININFGDNVTETLSGRKTTIYNYKTPGKYLVTLEVKPLPIVKKYLTVPTGEIVDVPVEIPSPPKVIPSPEPKTPLPVPLSNPNNSVIGYKPKDTGNDASTSNQSPVSSLNPELSISENSQGKTSNKDFDRRKAIVDELKSKTNANVLLEALSKLRNQGKLSFGKKTDFVFPEKCNVILVESQSKQVKFILGARDERTRDLLSNTPIKPEELKNLTAIWVEIY